MTSDEWDSTAINLELEYIEQWGKAEISGVSVRACQNMPKKPTSKCYFGPCGCETVGWGYYWTCWCDDGWLENTWVDAMEQLEIHMLRGYHK